MKHEHVFTTFYFCLYCFFGPWISTAQLPEQARPQGSKHNWEDACFDKGPPAASLSPVNNVIT